MLITNQYCEFLQALGARLRRSRARVVGKPKPFGHGARASLQAEQASSTRIAVRSVDSAANPYLAYAAMLGAGLKGIEEGLDLCAPVEENLFKLSQAEIAERGLKYLPRDLSQAIDEFEKSELHARDSWRCDLREPHFGQTRRMGRNIART